MAKKYDKDRIIITNDVRQTYILVNKLKGKKIILNRSVLSQSDVADFEKESGSKVFYNMPNVDDKIDDNVVIKKLLKELGFTRIDDHESKGFSLFR